MSFNDNLVSSDIRVGSYEYNRTRS
jgi:hypothetical protein